MAQRRARTEALHQAGVMVPGRNESARARRRRRALLGHDLGHLRLPRARARVVITGVEARHRELNAKACRFMRPGLEVTARGTLETWVADPFGNVIRFCETRDPASHKMGAVVRGERLA